MTLTKAAGGVLAAWLILLLGKWAAEELYHVDGHGEQAYVIDTGAEDTAEVEEEVDFSEILASADIRKGERVYKNCAACHRLEDFGLAVGPDLLAITSRSKPALLSAILEPSRNVDPRYLAYSAHGEESVLAFGMIAAETATSVIFRMPDGSEKAVLRKDIVKLEGMGRSLMPDGLEANLDLQAMADLLSYLGEVLPPTSQP